MKNDKNHDASRNYPSIPVGCVVVVQLEEDGPWTHGTVEGKEDHNQNNRYYTIHITKTAQHITRNSKHVKTTPITSRQYVQDQLNKNIRADTVEGII